ncbi:MAG TPA: hypothetical protein VMK84_04285 [Streptosporangiaceae bacterium]|nr:hypothetical protein [Streptosporangiaceae bacterium]
MTVYLAQAVGVRRARQRRGNLGTDDALDTERAASSRREIAADGASARRDEVITRGHRRIQREEPGAEMTEHASWFRSSDDRTGSR